jgi:cell surface protein SprA
LKNFYKYIFSGVVLTLFWTLYNTSDASNHFFEAKAKLKVLPPDTTGLPYPMKDDDEMAAPTGKKSPLYLKDPSNIESKIEYDPGFNEYVVSKKMGKIDFRLPSSMTPEEYKRYQFRQSMRQYWKQRAKGDNTKTGKSFIPKLVVGGEAFDKVFGSNVINIVPQGSAELIFGIKTNKIDNPLLSVSQRKSTTFDFQEKIQMNVNGTIGDKMKLGISYNTEATFDFENKTKLEYTGKEDEIIKKIEAGNVSMPLTGTLITGSQSLFGLKTEMQFGRVTATSVLSQQKGQSQTINTKGGAQTTTFEIKVANYDANRHFFLDPFFYENYNTSLKNLPLVSSGVTITNIEVWVTNKTSTTTDTRNILALTDIGAGSTSSNPYNTRTVSGKTNVYSEIAKDTLNRTFSKLSSTLAGYNLTSVKDYEKIQKARKLKSTEYTVNKKLGYISLKQALSSDQVLAVAYSYQYKGKKYKVGELSTDGITGTKTLILKLIKPTSLSPRYSSTWHLMMKNVYSLGAYQVSSKDFKFNILYENDKLGTSVNYLTEGDIKEKILLKVLHLDNENAQNEPYPDGLFDFIDGVTIDAANGRIYFPLVEPFGKDLADKIGSSTIASKYTYTALYDSTQTKAKQISSKNKFILKGSYQSSATNEISLNAMNIPQGSVTVTSGGIKLVENVDYTVDYTLGKVKIINSGLLSSGTPISVSLENSSLYNIQTKTFLGTHLNYKISDDFNAGLTLLHLSETPLTKKVSIGDEPISNTMLGLDMAYTTKSQFLTNLVDKIPFIHTKEISSVSVNGEFAKLIPGYSSAISDESYIDDFESSQTSIDMRSYYAWSLASTPQGQTTLFPEGSSTALANRYNVGKIAWYTIDPILTNNSSSTPSNIKDDQEKYEYSHYVRPIYIKELFPNKEISTGSTSVQSIFNVAFYPDQRGPYNYTTKLNKYGRLSTPSDSWGGIQRSLTVTDFESANIQYIDFWLMDPFVEDLTNSGELYFNLGDVSEDVLRDSRLSVENGLPSTADSLSYVDSTTWGHVPQESPLTTAFTTTDATSRKYQDVGLDGISDATEQVFFKSYVDSIKSIVTDPVALAGIEEDPSADDFRYFLNSNYDNGKAGILERYKKFNGTEDNSPVGTTYYGSASPNNEDINSDNTLNESENYYQYKVELSSAKLKVGENYITDSISDTPITGVNKTSVNWYHFRIPISGYTKSVGSPDLTSMRFMRMFAKNFKDSVVLRFATLDLQRGEWIKYDGTLADAHESVSTHNAATTFSVSAVSIEEDGSKTPVNYVLPPGVSRTIDPTSTSTTTTTQLDEQSMSLKVTDLADGDNRAVYKATTLDLRDYKRLKMFTHAEALTGETLKDNDLAIFIRLGSDYTDNYYEYQVKLKVTPKGTYSSTDANRYIVWPDSNVIDIDLSLFQKAKQARALYMSQNSSNTNIVLMPFHYADGDNQVTIVGYPTISNVQTMMIGIRNPKATKGTGASHSAEVWVDELRVSGLNEKGGWAAKVGVTTKLADLGSVTLAGSISTPGFGSLSSKLNERSKDELMEFDMASNFELGKFFPSKLGISIPMYVGFSEKIDNPEYNPLDPDVKMADALNACKTKRERDSLKRICQGLTIRKSLNFTNVRIGKPSAKPKLYDISNFSFSYSYSKLYERDVNTEYNIEKHYTGSLLYTYSIKPKNIAPFKKMNFLSYGPLNLIKEFNFYYLPSKIMLRSDFLRDYTITKIRDVSNSGLKIDSTVSKDIYWNRYYELKFDLSKSLSFDFSASNKALIDEPLGAIDKTNARDAYYHWRDSVWSNFKKLGRTTDYRHEFNVNYVLPINKFPLFNWTNFTAKYTGTYEWIAGTILADTSIHLGNTIKNSGNQQYNATFTMNTLYNKINYLKKLNQKKAAQKDKKPKLKKVTFDKDNIVLKSSKPKIVVHNLGTEDVKVKMYDEKGKEIPGKVEVLNTNKIIFTSDSSYRNVHAKVEGNVEEKPNPFAVIVENLAKIMMSLKNVSVGYQLNNTTTLPGFLPKTSIFGSQKYENQWAPGLPFILGWQNPSFDTYAIKHNWLTTDTSLSDPMILTHYENLTMKASFEPIPGLKIDLVANRSYSETTDKYLTAYANKTFPSTDLEKGTTVSGSYSISYISWGTAFEKVKASNTYHSKNFDRFQDYRNTIQQRLVKERSNSDPTYLGSGGYGNLSQNVLIPSFISAYGIIGPSAISLNPMPKWYQQLPFPNWRVSYDGLSKLGFIQDYIKTIALTHAYSSTYNIGSFASSDTYVDNGHGFTDSLDLNYNYVPKYTIATVSITEQFSPLIGVNITWKNKMITSFDYKRSRNLSLSLTNDQLTETGGTDYTIGAGYKFNQVEIIVGEKAFKSDLILKADVSLKNSLTVVRTVSTGKNTVADQASAGQNVVAVKVTADYALSDRFNLRLFYDRTVTSPVLSTSYKTYVTDVGFSVRFTLAQ